MSEKPRRSELEMMMTIQRDKYRILQNSAPVGSGCWEAAKTTADEAQKVIDWHASQGEPNRGQRGK